MEQRPRQTSIFLTLPGSFYKNKHFPILRLDCRESCGINVGGAFILTGGRDDPFQTDSDTFQTVVHYSLNQGYDLTYLAELQTGRYAHACSHFTNANGETVSSLQKVEIIIDNVSESSGYRG